MISEDEVLDFMIMEAVYAKVQHEDNEAKKADAIKKWRQDTSNLDQFR